MTKEEAKEILISTLREINSDEQNISCSSEEFTEAILLAINVFSKPSLPSNLDEAAGKYADEPYYAYPPEFLDFVKEEIREAFKAGVVWMAKQHADDMGEAIEKAFYEGVMYETKQGVSYQATISANKTIPVLPMKDVSDMGLDYGDNVIVQIRKKD